MAGNIRAAARRQFFRYFKGWIIAAAVLLAIWGILAVIKMASGGSSERNNPDAPSQRVYDYADVLTDSQEEMLAQFITKCEKEGACDIVLVTICEEMGLEDWEWERNMMNYADDFYDNGAFGYDKPYGDGVLILDNWYQDENGSQEGTWLSTSGKMEEIIGPSEENDIFDALYAYISEDPLKGYVAAVQKTAEWGSGKAEKSGVDGFYWMLAAVIPIVIAVIYALVHIRQTADKDTTAANTYVAGGQPVLRGKRDEFQRKSTSSVRIQTDSGGSGRSSGGSSHGGGSSGHHTSSGGHSHGGGGRRR